jgi:hypothetical protein
MATTTYGIMTTEPLIRCEMPGSVTLRELPKLLAPKEWKILRACAPSDRIALTYLNSPYPDDPDEFFWGYKGTIEEARNCYAAARIILKRMRTVLLRGELQATGLSADKKPRQIPPADWIDLWPMPATNWASGPNGRLEEIQLIVPPKESLSAECTAWLRAQRPDVLKQKKLKLFEMAKRGVNPKLTRRAFDRVYKAIFQRGRGRPRKVQKISADFSGLPS